jgi:lipopolysaccharide transport system permease protein
VEPTTTELHVTKRSQRMRIQPADGWEGLHLREVWAFRDLLWILMMRDIKLRYKQTALGVIWVVLQPLAAALIFALIFGRFANLPSNGTPYLLYVFAGLLPWNLFAGALQRAGNSLISDARLISKVYFPRLVIPIASAAAVLVDFIVGMAVMLVLLAIYAVPVTVNLLAFPLVLAVALLLAVGVSLFFSALNVYYRDFMYALPFVVQVWMYASPVVYSASLIPGPLRFVYALNPMVGVIDGFRWSLLGKGEFPLLSLGLSLGVAVLVFTAGALVFQRVERSFADVV